VSRIALLDTSIFVAKEVGRVVDPALLPDEGAVSVVTIAELEAGVLAAADVVTRSRRARTARLAGELAALPITEEVAQMWAQMRVVVGQSGRRINVNDLWIAATAAVHGMPVCTQDDDFDVLAELGLVAVLKI
jgi:predicted nucleic acid-binding protein